MTLCQLTETENILTARNLNLQSCRELLGSGRICVRCNATLESCSERRTTVATCRSSAGSNRTRGWSFVFNAPSQHLCFGQRCLVADGVKCWYESSFCNDFVWCVVKIIRLSAAPCLGYVLKLGGVIVGLPSRNIVQNACL